MEESAMRVFLHWLFLIHLWTLAGLGFAMLAAQHILLGNFDAAARWLLLVLVVDHTDGTLARRYRVRQRLSGISGEILDLITDVIGLTFVPMLFCWRTGMFLDGWGRPLLLAAAITCSLKYSMKARILEEGVSHGAPPVFFSVLLFWLLKLPIEWATIYTSLLVLLCWLPIPYPITSLVTTHWKPGFESLTNYGGFAAIVPAMLWLREAPGIFYWIPLILVIFQLFMAPVLLALRIIRPGFRRIY
jgi:phosphatidylcholine synthase